MKKLFITGFAICMASISTNAQTTPLPKPLAKPKLIHLPTLDSKRQIELWQHIQQNKEALKNIQTPQLQEPQQGQMPVTGNVPAPQLVGNNKNGFDVLQSPVDNMQMIKPDSSVVFNIPTGKDKFIQVIPEAEK